jgi:hypothetical protein
MIDPDYIIMEMKLIAARQTTVGTERSGRHIHFPARFNI